MYITLRSRAACVAAFVAVSGLVLAGLSTPSSASTHRGVRTHSFAIMKVFNRAGKVIYRHRFGPGSEGKVLHVPPAALVAARGHGTGGTPSASGGPIKVTVHQAGHSFPSNDKLWEWDVWTEWSWDNSPQRTVWLQPNDTDGRSYHHEVDSPGVSYDGVQAQSRHYYSWNGGSNHSGYHNMVQGAFTVPNVLSPLGNHEYPKDILESHANGTWEWWTSCCGN